MFGCYRKAEASDPEIYAAATAAVLSEYPQEIVDYVTDPRTGLPSTSKWLPSVFEVREACELQVGRMKTLAAIHERADRERRVVANPNNTAHQRAAAAEWLEMYERNYMKKSA